jgi:hypothetical protein
MLNGDRHPGARALSPIDERNDDAVSGARISTPRSPGMPPSTAHPSQPADAALASVSSQNTAPLPEVASQRPPLNGDWGQLAMARTVLLSPTDEREETSASASHVVTPSTRPIDGPIWFRSGNTVPPPSMRPVADSAALPSERKPPNPRVLKIVGGVLAVCLTIVAVAGLKVLYLRLRAPVATAAPTTELLPAAAAAAGTSHPVALGTSSDRAVAPPPGAPTGGTTSSSSPANTPHATPERRVPAPARIIAKPAPRRAPLPKKVRRTGR